MDEIETLKAALAGRYEIERQIGHGGMATVYLARDERHDRHVAVKVLRPELAAVIGPQRFLAEIKIVAGLQHPHILPLHDSGESGGTVFYVMPFVEGETLRDRLKHEKQLPVDDAVRIAREVASALDYAHRRGIVHRDIKPENILLHDGQALVADFGIALAVSRSDGGTRMTETGMSLGTPHYMAPEQAMGEREISPKADIYALGCVLYEMLTGDPPFTGSTAQAIVARAVTESPRALTIQRHTIPRHIEAAVMASLEKLPADRFASAEEFAAALTNPLYGAEAGAARVAPRDARRALLRSPLVLTLGALALVTSVALATVLLRPAPAQPVMRFGIAFAPAQAPLADLPFALSPDGGKLAYAGPYEGFASQVWVKDRDKLDAVPVPGTNGVTSFAFSPDGNSLAFVSLNGQLKKVPLTGGAAVTIADTVAAFRGVAWLDDGSVVAIGVGGNRLIRVAAGQPPEKVWTSDSAGAFLPVALPGGQGVLFTRCSLQNCDLVALELSTRAVDVVVTGTATGRYVSSGHVVYVRLDGGMLAVPFKLSTLKATAAPIPVMDGIAGTPWPLFDIARDGTLAARFGAAGTSRASTEMVWVDRAGRETLVDSAWRVALTANGSPPNVGWALSPDGQRLAIGLNTDVGDDIWIKQLPRGPLSRLSFDSAAEFRPRWTRDGRAVLFSSLRTGPPAIYRRAADATGTDELVFRDPRSIFEAAISPDGKYMVLRTGGTGGGAGGRDISIAELGKDSVPRPLIATPFDEEAIAISPDGRWIAYESDETGRTEVFVRPFLNVEAGKWQISTAGGRSPLWARNGRELFFVDGARSMMAVSVTSGANWTPGEPKALFRMRDELYLQKTEYYTPFDVSADGQRFIMARRVASSGGYVPPLVMVTNWTEELRAKTRK